MKVGYARVSTRSQHLDRQISALEAEGCQVIFQEKISGKNTKDRPELAKAINTLNKGDIFVVADWDRATRSYDDGFKLISNIHKQDAQLKVLDRPYLDLTTPMGKAILGVLSAMFEDERKRIRKSADEGRAEAIKRGVKIGAPRTITPQQIKKIKRDAATGKYSYKQIGQRCGVSATTVFRYLQ